MAGEHQTAQRIANGPQILCRMCGEVCNHLSGLCEFHRYSDGGDAALTAADKAYLDWKRERDANRG